MNESRLPWRARYCRTRYYRAEDALYLCALLALILLWMGPAWSRQDGMWYAPGAAYSDLTITHWPNWQLVRENVYTYGQVPLWRPAILGGAPHAGNPLAALFYPPNWLALLLPLTRSFDLQYALHAFGAGVALYALARWGYGRSSFAAFIGALGYALTPKWLAHLGAGHVGFCQAYAWLPLIAWSLRACFRPQETGFFEKNPVSLGTLACAAALALTYLADPRVASYALGMAALYTLYRLIGVWRQSGWRAALRLSLYLSLIPLAFLLLAAVQILPTAELMPMTTRAAITMEEAGYDSLPWRYLIGYLIADRGGYHEWMTYLGLLPLGLLPLALWKSVDRERWFWAGLAILALLYALGTNGPLFPLLYRLLPALGWVRVPSRALILVTLSANLLAAWGADALLAAEKSARARRWAARLALSGVLTCAGLGLGLAVLYGQETPPAAHALAWGGAAVCGIWLLSQQPHVPRARPPRALVQASLLALLIADLWPVGHSLIERRPAVQIFGEGAATVAYLAEKAASGGPTRVYSPSYSVPQHVAARLGLEQLDGVDPVQLSWAAAFIGLAGGYPAHGYSVTQPPFPHGADPRNAWQDATPDAALLGALNVCAVAAEFPIEAPGLVLETRIGETYLYANQRCLPRAYLVTRVEPVAGWQEAQHALQAGLNPARGALIEGGQALDGAPEWKAATVREHTPNRIVVETEATQDSLLVLAEVWAPGWHVTVDGIEHPYHRVNGVTRGVYIEPGAHTVVWSYRPASLRWGAALTICALLVFAMGTILWLRDRYAPRNVL